MLLDIQCGHAADGLLSVSPGWLPPLAEYIPQAAMRRGCPVEYLSGFSFGRPYSHFGN